MASMPRPGYTALLGYDEEGRLTGIQHSAGGATTPAYEYGYGADGGRRWRKDVANNVWTWYPCGVACCAGSLVEKQSDLTGSSWTTSAQLVRGNGLVSRATGDGSEFHLPNLGGVNAVITGSSGSVLSSNVYDSFGVQQAVQGTAMTPFRYGQQGEEATVKQGNMNYLPSAAAQGVKPKHPAKPPTPPSKPCGPKVPGRNCTTDLNQCELQPTALYTAELTAIGITAAALIQKCNAAFNLDPTKRLRLICIASVAVSASVAIALSYVEEQKAFGACRTIYEACRKVPGNTP